MSAQIAMKAWKDVRNGLIERDREDTGRSVFISRDTGHAEHC